MRLGELGGRVGGRDREDTHAGLQRRLDSCAGIFDDETFAGSKEGWSGAAGVELSKREFIHRGIGLADGAFVRGHDEFESSLDGRSREGGENVFPSASRCDGQPVVPERSFDKPGHPGKKRRRSCRRMLTEQRRFPFGDPGMNHGVASAIPFQQQSGGTGPLIHPEIGVIVLVLADRQSGFSKRLLKTFQVRCFVVGDDAVEVKNDCAQSRLLCAALTDQRRTLAECGS